MVGERHISAVELATPVLLTGPDVWMGEPAQSSEDWVHQFSDADIAEIDAAYDELFNWKPPYQKQSELRCYNVEETKYGTRQRCFSD